MNQDEIKVLVVEDDPILRLLVCKQLELLNLSSVEAADGKIALERFCADRSIVVVLMDLMMPVIDGLEATKAIRSFEKTSGEQKKTPIIGMTAYGEREICIAAGMDDFVFKPVMLEQLSQVLFKWLPPELLRERLTKSGEFSGETVRNMTNQVQEELKETGAQLEKVQQQIDDLKQRFGL